MSSRITAGIDVGTYEVRVVVAEQNSENSLPTILGTGRAESKGLRHGYIINTADVTKSVGLAIKQAEKSSGIKIKKVFITLIFQCLDTITKCLKYKTRFRKLLIYKGF